MSNLRLTLRTLLAYLDDTLDPAEIKSIGEKVKESKTAQELIERIRKLVRKRRLTTPPFTGPDARFDANTIAEYLDNTLDSKAVAELEEFCREENPAADLYLAEVASSHQILALVLGEPMMVPATAKQRMYGLVKGREANPNRKPASTTQTPKLTTSNSHADMDLDEGSPLLGLSPRKKPWLVWAVPAIAALLLVGAGLALFFALPNLTDEPGKHHASTTTKDDKKDKDAVKDKDALKDKDLARDKDDKKDLDPVKDKDKDAATAKDKDLDPVKDKDAVKDAPKDRDAATVKDKDAGPVMPPITIPPPAVVEAPGEASPVKADAATYSFDPRSPTILLQKKDRGWTRLPINGKVTSAEPVVALPGSACALRTTGGAHLTLRGFLPQWPLPPVLSGRLLDAAVTLHQNPRVAADLTLHRGRLYVGNEAQPLSVIVRFGKEAWVVTLTEPNSEFGIDLVTRYTPGTNHLDGEEPLTEAFFLVLKGKVDLKVDTFEFPGLSAPVDPPAGVSFYAWTNKGARLPAPQPSSAAALTIWTKDAPKTESAQKLAAALERMHLAMTGMKSIPTVLKETRIGQDPDGRRLAIYALSAIDEVGELLDALGDADPKHGLERDEATYALRRWISRDAKHNLALYDVKEKKGLLIDAGFRSSEAEAMLSLLHGLSGGKDGGDDVPTRLAALLAYMGNEKLQIRHVAHFVFDALTQSVMNKPPYNAAAPLDERRMALEKYQTMLASGALTPMPTRPMGPGSSPP